MGLCTPHPQELFEKSSTKKLKLGRTKYCNRSLFDAFSFDAIGPKEKAWRKENAVSVGCAPTPRSLFWKKARQKTKLKKARRPAKHKKAPRRKSLGDEKYRGTTPVAEQTATSQSSSKLVAMITGQAVATYLIRPLCSGVRLFRPIPSACTIRRLSAGLKDEKLIPSSHLKKLYHTIA